MGAGESKASDELVTFTRRMWRPTTEWWLYVAFVLNQRMPNNKGFVEELLIILEEMVFQWYDFDTQQMVSQRSDDGFELDLHKFPCDMKAPNVAIQCVTKMFSCTTLFKLNLSDTRITDIGIAALAESLPSSRIEFLYLSKCGVTDSGVAALTKSLPESPHLTTLDLNQNSITDAGAISLANCLHIFDPVRQLCRRRSRLRHIRLRGNYITDVGATRLAKTVPDSNMENISLSWNKITDDGAMKIMHFLKQRWSKSGPRIPTPRLERLYLRWNNITDVGVAFIAERLSNSNLLDLNLNYTYTGDRGAKALAKCLPFCQLQILGLRGNYITDDGAKALKKSLRRSQLLKLNLLHNNVSVDCPYFLGYVLNRNQKQINVLVQPTSYNPFCSVSMQMAELDPEKDGVYETRYKLHYNKYTNDRIII